MGLTARYGCRRLEVGNKTRSHDSEMSNGRSGTAACPIALQSRIFMLVAVIAICSSLFASYRIGVERGFPDTIGTGAWGRMLFAFGAAIAQMRHGGYGYTIPDAMETVLTYGGLTGDSKILTGIGRKFPENLRDPALIDAAIGKAVRFSSPIDPNQGVRGSGGDDLGFVDYTRLSFGVFGYRLRSLYLAYFAIFGISASAFAYAFRSRPGLLAILVIACAAHVFLFSSSILDRHNLSAIADPRFLSVLAVIPCLHLACLLLTRSPATGVEIALALLQSIVLVFAVWIRATAIWTIMGLSMLALGIAAIGVLKRCFQLHYLWSLGVLLSAWLVHAVWTSISLHPVYREKGEISHHVLWQAIFYQLQFHPQWRERYGAEYDNAVLDELPLVAARKYLARHPHEDLDDVYLTSDRKYLKVAQAETYVRKAFFEFLASDPKFVLETYFIHIPIKLFFILGPMQISVQSSYLGIHPADLFIGPRAELVPLDWQYVGVLGSFNRTSAVQFMLLCLSFFVMAGFLVTEPEDRRLLQRCVLLLTAGFFVSLWPVLPAPDIQVVADQYFVLLLALGGWAVLALCAGMRACIRLRMPGRA
jgi:hypothetical protein